MKLPRLSMLAVLALWGCPSGYEFQLSPGAPSLVTDSLLDVIVESSREAEDTWEVELYPQVPADADPRLARRGILTGGEVADSVCRELRPVLSFVHLSDAQIKEHSVSMAGPLGKLYDVVADGAFRPDDLERFDYTVLLATILGVNRLAQAPGGANAHEPCPAPLEPEFVIHTGDALDAGMFSELFEFLTIMGQLAIPFYNVLGNHDVLFFGTFPAGAMEGLNVVLPFVPVRGARPFMQAHHPEAERADISIPALLREQHAPTEAAELDHGRTIRSMPGSAFHGFDLACPQPWNRIALCDEAHGYYALELVIRADEAGAGDIRLWLLVLNTAELTPSTKGEALSQQSRGKMSDAQFEWLEQQLARAEAENALVLVAGHHPVESFVGEQRERVRTALTGSPRVLAYVAGHTHVNEFRRHPRGEGRPPLWEIIAGSNMASPQLGAVVELLESRQDSGLFYLRVRSFREALSTRACPGDPEGDETLPCLAKRARLAALADTTDGAHRTEAAAVPQANGMLRVEINR